MQGGLITITRYAPFSTAYYTDPNVSAKDQTSNVVSIPLNLKEYTTSPVTRALVSTSPNKFLKISIIVQDCSQLSDIELTDGNIARDLNFYSVTNPASFLDGESFDDTYYSVNVISPAQLCKPNITSVNPTSVTAGTNSKITIEGFGFGTTRGNGAVVFQDAGSSSDAPIKVNDNVDVLTWTDTKIEYIVPSTFFAAANSTSGTGKISVLENTGKESEGSNEVIEVSYAIINTYNTGDSKKYPVIHTETPNGTLGKITFYLTEELRLNSAYYNLIRQAINDIVCATSVNFEVSNIAVSNTRTGLLKDGTAIISLAGDNLFSKPNTLMATQRHVTEYCTKGTQKWFVSSESDIIIKRSINWSTTQPYEELPKDQHDFYNTILHELGHAAGLDHVVSSTELMKPELLAGERASSTRFSYDNFPNDNSKKGVAWLLAEGDKYDNVGSSCQTYKKMAPKKSCTIITGMEDDLIADYFTLLTNPVISDEAIISVGANYQNTAFSYELISMQGQIMTKGTVSASATVAIPFQGIQPNLYFVVLTNQNGQKHTFKIVKQ